MPEESVCHILARSCAGDLDYGQARLLERLDVLPLVRKPPLEQRLQDRIQDLRFLHRPAGNCRIESGEMMTVQVADEIGGAEANLVADLLHTGYVTAPNHRGAGKLVNCDTSIFAY